MRKIIPVNQKGGVGKTLVSFNFSHHLADEGNRVLLGDGDEQGNSSRGTDAYALAGVGASRLFGSEPIIVPASMTGLVVLQADKEGLRAVERSELDDMELVANLRARLEELAPHFDYAVFDSPGSNSRVANALLAVSDYAIIPCKLDQDSIDVAAEVAMRVAAIQADWNPALVNLGILPNEYDPHQPAQKESLRQLLSLYQSIMFPAYITDRSAYREARAAAVPVWRLRGDGDEQTKNRMKTAVREAGKEIRTVFKMVVERMEQAR